MLEHFKDLFNPKQNSSGNEEYSNQQKLQIAACALLLEIANADEKLDAEEEKRIKEIMKNKFNLSDNDVENVISKSEEEIINSVSIYEFTDVLNKILNNDDKYLLLKYLWHIAYADGNLDTYEDYYIKKISNNLHLYNKDRIAAKLEVKTELGI